MDDFLRVVDEEKRQMEKLIMECKTNSKKIPKGFLKLRKIKKGYAIAKVIPYNKKYREVRITDNPDEIFDYLYRDINKKRLAFAEKNFSILEKVLNQYKLTDIKSLWQLMPERLHAIKQVLDDNITKNTKAAMFDSDNNSKNSNCINRDSCQRDEKHKLRTQCGVWVRSKNELYICDRLDFYNIKFEYEPQMYINGRIYQPDFVIHLPDGSLIIWEHFGMMNEIDYCRRNAVKIYDYFADGYIIGKKLIATCSDAKGELDTLEINKIITQKILPYYLL